MRDTSEQRILRAILYRVPFSRQRDWLLKYGERFMDDPTSDTELPRFVLPRLAWELSLRLDEIGMWLNKHGLTKKVKS